jgi:protein-arginine kinase
MDKGIITNTKTKLAGRTMKITQTVEKEMTSAELLAQSNQFAIQLTTLKNQMSLIKTEYDRISALKEETDNLLSQFPEEELPSI